MPAESYLVSAARGAVLDTTAIPEAVKSGQFAGAAIECWSTSRTRTMIR